VCHRGIHCIICNKLDAYNVLQPLPGHFDRPNAASHHLRIYDAFTSTYDICNA
jgi:hypothetical protein